MIDATVFLSVKKLTGRHVRSKVILGRFYIFDMTSDGKHAGHRQRERERERGGGACMQKLWLNKLYPSKVTTYCKIHMKKIMQTFCEIHLNVTSRGVDLKLACST